LLTAVSTSTTVLPAGTLTSFGPAGAGGGANGAGGGVGGVAIRVN